ncbi:MAG TPA: hypothetical protein VM008_06385 [Phycisphaerae bacterium]|nr:hypothetical protein [Phycisphaerae bacterium]
MKKLLIFAGLGEIAAGMLLLIAPSLGARLLLGAELTGVAIPVARVAGIALLSLGLGCCSGSVWLAIWIYTTLAALYLAYLGVATEWTGILLWPAVAAHAALTVFLIKPQNAPSPRPASTIPLV